MSTSTHETNDSSQNKPFVFYTFQNAIKRLCLELVGHKMEHSPHHYYKIQRIIQDNAFIYS